VRGELCAEALRLTALLREAALMALHAARLPARIDSAGDHIEAAIAAVHASPRTLDETDWPKIVSLYDRLFDLAPSPMVALNRAIAIGERDGPTLGLEALNTIADVRRLTPYPFYPAAMGEFARRLGTYDAARAHFQAAISRARNAAERRFLQERLRSLDMRV
jgi:predicted RNA polymerase sigma factor